MNRSTLESVGQDVRYLRESFDEHKTYTAEQFGEVKERQDHTNGRIGKAERRLEFMKGGLTVLTVLVIPILFIFIKAALDVWSR